MELLVECLEFVDEVVKLFMSEIDVDVVMLVIFWCGWLLYVCGFGNLRLRGRREMDVCVLFCIVSVSKLIIVVLVKMVIVDGFIDFCD